MDGFEFTEHDRLIADLICVGVIAEVDHAAKRIRVQSRTLTAWLPWPAELGRNFIRWRPLRPGQQVVLASPSGDLAQALVIGMLYTSALTPTRHDPDLDVIAFDDRTTVTYDSGNHHLQLDVAGSMTIRCRDDFVVQARNVRLN